MNYVLVEAGNTLPVGPPVNPDIAEDDGAIRDAFRDAFPVIDQATLTREVQDDLTVIRIVPDVCEKGRRDPQPPNLDTLTEDGVRERLLVALGRRGWKPWQFSSPTGFNYDEALDIEDFLGEFLYSLQPDVWTVTLEVEDDEEPELFDSGMASFVAARRLPTDDENFTRTESHDLVLFLDAKRGEKSDDALRAFAADVLVMVGRARRVETAPQAEEGERP